MDSLTLPLNLASFRLLAELGVGSQGRVFLAELLEERYRLPPGQKLALKFLHAELLSDRAALERFEREAKLGNSLRSDYLVRIHGLEEVELQGQTRFFLVMEYLHGHSLRKLLTQDGPAVEGLVRRIGRDAGLGLSVLHGKGIVHRDVKPENLFLTQAGQSKLMDLGFAGRGGHGASGQTSGGLRGSLAYTAPELLLGRSARPPSDLWSLGIVLYELATGQHPFLPEELDRGGDELLEALLHESPPPPSSQRPRLSPFFDHLCLRLLSKDPKDRPGASDLAHMLEQGESAPFFRQLVKKTPRLSSELRLARTRRPTDLAFLGREEIWKQLDKALTSARGGSLQILHLRGPEGVGKRRLIDEWMSKKLEGQRPPLYFPGEPATRSEARLLSPLDSFLVEQALRFVPESPNGPGFRGSHQPRFLAGRIAVRMEEELGISEARALRMARWLAGCQDRGEDLPDRLLAETLAAFGSEAQPLVLRLHRPERLLHAALEVLRHLASLPTDKHVMILFTSHQEDRPPDLAGLEVEEIEVEQFDATTAQTFFRSLFLNKEEAARACSEMLKQLPPVPGLVLEALAWMRDQGLVQGDFGELQDIRLAAQLPLRGLLRQSLEVSWDQLAPADRELLQAAAVLGSRFRATDLAELLACSELEILERLSAIRSRWILSFGGDMRFRRRSQRHFALASIDDERRRKLHAATAGLFQAHGSSPQSVGMQWSRAGEHVRALPLLLEAARGLLERGGRSRVSVLLRHCELHLAQIPRTPLHLLWRLDWLVLSARLDLERDRPREAIEKLQRGLAMTRALNRKPQEASIRSLFAVAERRRGRLVEALHQCQTALAILDLSLDHESLIDLLLLRSELLADLGQLKEALETVLAAQDLYGEARNLPLRLGGRISLQLGRLQAARLRLEGAEQHFARAELIFIAEDDYGNLLSLRFAKARFALQLGERTRPLLRALLQEHLQSRDAGRVHELMALSLIRDRRYERARTHLLEARRLYDDAGECGRMLLVRLRDLECQIELGLATESRARRLHSEAMASDMPRARIRAARLLAALLREQGEYTEALALLDESTRSLRRLSLEPLQEIRLRRERARLLAAWGQPEAARRQQQLAARWLDKLAHRFPRRSTAKRFLARWSDDHGE